MPEIPDLLYIQSYLQRHVVDTTVIDVTIRQPVVVRNMIDEPVERALDRLTITMVDVHGPFLRFGFSGSVDMILNLMLAGKLQHQQKGEHEIGHLCLSLKLDNGSRLNLCDEQKMAKVYLVHRGEYGGIPKYDQQGIDVLSDRFTIESFLALLERHGRRQVRVLINDHTVLSSIGNAYADEILYEAGIHPKTFVGRLTVEERTTLHQSIRKVLDHGTRAVADARQPIHIKVREHMQVRNRKGQPCFKCGTTIRREGVRGYDVFFCPRCQPPSRELFIDWGKVSHH